MQRQPRLSRQEVVARLRELAEQHGGAVSLRLIATHDGQVLRSLRLHFPSFALACRAARVEVAKRPPRTVAQPGPHAVWSKGKVVDELKRLDEGGASTGWAELMEGERAALVRAAAAHAGGLLEARTDAGVEAPERLPSVPQWDQDSIVAGIRERVRAGQTLASSRAPQRFVAAARWHFGSWEDALAAAGVDPATVRLQRGAYTEAEVLELIREMAREGLAVRSSTLRERIKVDAVRKLFGSIDAAVRAAGIEQVVTHGNQKWTRESVIEELRARAKRGQDKLTRGLQRAVQLYFGGAHAAREAAELPPLLRAAWTEESLIKELKRRARRGERLHALRSVCKRLFGSVEAARDAAGVTAAPREPGMATWDGPALLAELRRRLRHRQQLGRGLVEGLRREFGSVAVARALAERRRREGREGGKLWPRAKVIVRLQAWHAAGGGALSKPLANAAKREFGSLARACASAAVPMPAVPWTAKRVLEALRDARAEVVDPELVKACIEHFGSVTAARAEVARQQQRRWSKETVIGELQARARRGLKGVGRLLREPAIRLFGSTDAALLAAARAVPHAARKRTRPGDERG